jgi:hypothetical protein
MYADDIQLYLHFPLCDFDKYLKMLICDILYIIKYCEQHNLVLNVSKTQAIIIGSLKYISTDDTVSFPPLIVNGYVVPYSSTVKNLGVIFDTTLSWTDECNALVRKVFGTLAELRRNFSYIPPNIRKILATSLVMPHLDYPALLFSDIPGYNNDKLQRVQNACVRFITGATRYEHVTPYYESLGLLKLKARRTLAMANMVFKIITTGVPLYLFERYQFASANNSRDTRSNKLQLQIPNHRTQKYHLSFLIQSSLLWNKLQLYECVDKSANFVRRLVVRHLEM